MTTDERREQLRGQIVELRKKRDASSSDDEKKAANEAIDAIEHQIREINIGTGPELAAKIDALIKDLDAVLDKYQLDAVSALGRTIQKARSELAKK